MRGMFTCGVIDVFMENGIDFDGACGISAFPMSAGVVTQMALKEDPSNILIMQATGVNVSGQIASVIAGGLILSLIAR